MSDHGRRLLTIVVSLALGWSCPTVLRAAIPPPLDSQSLSFEVGPSVSSVAVGDLDVDGVADVLVTHARNPGWISVMRGDGIGRYALSTTVPVGNDPFDLTLADLNRDGLLDVAVANHSSASVSLLLGTGGGALGSRVDIGVVPYPEAICHGDFNSDGVEDLAVASAGTSASAVGLLLGAGDGTFPSRADFPCGAGPKSLAAADFDEDGNLDVVMVYGDAMCVMRGDGHGSLGECSTQWIGWGPCSVAVGDLDLDGHADVITANCQSNNISTRLGWGDGTFRPVFQFDTGAPASHPWPAAVAVDEMNGDGFPDWIVTSYGVLTVIFGDGQGGSIGRQSLSFRGGSRRVVTGRLSGDGRPDIASASGTSISVALADGSEVFRRKVECSMGAAGAGFAWGNLNGDSAPDFVVCHQSSNYLRAWLGNGDGTFNPGPTTGGTLGPIDAVLIDLDLDGRNDLAFASYYPPMLSVCLGTGGGAFGSRVDYALPKEPSRLTAADLDRDGRPDLIAAMLDSLAVFLGDGAGGLGQRIAVAGAGTPHDVKCADMDGDGLLDLVTANHLNSVSLIRGVGNGGFAPGVTYPLGRRPDAIAVVDCDGDGLLDVATANYITSSVSFLKGNGPMSLAPPVHYPVGTQPRDIAFADLEGDGDSELFTANASGTVTVLSGEPASFDERWELAAGFDPRRLAVVHVNGDEHPDIAILSGNTVPILPNLRAYLSVARREDRLSGSGTVFPNPSRSGVSVRVEVARTGTPSIRILDLAGRTIRRVLAGRWDTGHNTFQWDGVNDLGHRVAPGVYLVVLDLSGSRSVHRVVLLE